MTFIALCTAKLPRREQPGVSCVYFFRFLLLLACSVPQPSCLFFHTQQSGEGAETALGTRRRETGLDLLDLGLDVV